jgi:hypothetical protein
VVENYGLIEIAEIAHGEGHRSQTGRRGKAEG